MTRKEERIAARLAALAMTGSLTISANIL